jgi:hypothetical protein
MFKIHTKKAGFGCLLLKKILNLLLLLGCEFFCIFCKLQSINEFLHFTVKYRIQVING